MNAQMHSPIHDVDNLTALHSKVRHHSCKGPKCQRPRIENKIVYKGLKLPVELHLLASKPLFSVWLNTMWDFCMRFPSYCTFRMMLHCEVFHKHRGVFEIYISHKTYSPNNNLTQSIIRWQSSSAQICWVLAMAILHWTELASRGTCDGFQLCGTCWSHFSHCDIRHKTRFKDEVFQSVCALCDIYCKIFSQMQHAIFVICEHALIEVFHMNT